MIRNYKKKSGIRYYPKKIQSNQSGYVSIENHEKEILAVGYENKTIKKRQMESITYYGHTISVRD